MKITAFLKYFKSELFLQEIIIFSVAQFAGVFLVKRAADFLSKSQIQTSQITIFDFAILFLLGTAFMFLLSGKTKISGMVMNVFFIFTLFIGSNLFFSLLLNPASSFYFALAIVLARFLFPSIFLHNSIFLMSIVAFSSILALQINTTAIIVLLAILAVYDIISVYLTKHMVKMAKAMMDRHIIFGFIIPQKISQNFLGVKEGHSRGMGKADKKGVPVVFLGGGDVGLPLFLVANIALANIWQGVFIAVFAILGMILSYYLFVSQKLRKPMPALPPISMMVILGFVILKIIWG